MLRHTLAAVHLIALGLGLGAVLWRAAALRDTPGAQSLRQAFRADTLWGVAAMLWMVTGFWRLFGSVEKGLGYYLSNHVFYAKMGFFVLILGLEIWPMFTLIRWRKALARTGSGNIEEIAAPAEMRRIATISQIEAVLVVLMVFAAVAMARGVGGRS